MNGDGSQATRLTYNSTDDLGATWSPDGKTIAFYGNQFVPDGRGGLVAMPPPHVFLIDVESGVQTTLSEGRFPSWSQDGHRIAFDSSGAASRIFVINVDGTGVEQIANQPPARNIRPDWSPNGRQIAFASGPNGNEQIYVMNADGSDLTPLTSGNEFKMPALIEPDEAAREIVKGLEKSLFEIHFPKRFTGWLKLMRHLPYSLYFPAIRKMTGL